MPLDDRGIALGEGRRRGGAERQCDADRRYQPPHARSRMIGVPAGARAGPAPRSRMVGVGAWASAAPAAAPESAAMAVAASRRRKVLFMGGDAMPGGPAPAIGG